MTDVLKNIPISEYAKMPLDDKLKLMSKQTTIEEWNTLDGKKNIQIQSIKNQKTIYKNTYTIYGWEPIIILKFKYLAKNSSHKEIWDLIVWNGDNQFSDTDALDHPNIDYNNPFRFLTKEESEKEKEERGSNKHVRQIRKEETSARAADAAKVHAQVKKEKGGPVYLGGKKRRRKKKKAFPSRKKNNRKNRTKKKALSK